MQSEKSGNNGKFEEIILVDSKGKGHLFKKKFDNNSTGISNNKSVDIHNQFYNLYENTEVQKKNINFQRSDSTADTIVDKPFTETYENDYNRKFNK